MHPRIFNNKVIRKPETRHITLPLPYANLSVEDKHILYDNVFNLLKFIINNNKVILPSYKYCGKIFRSGKSYRFQDENGHLPEINSDGIDLNEGIFFNFVEFNHYLNLNQQEPNGLVMCRKIKNYDDVHRRLNIFIHFNNNISCKHLIQNNNCNNIFKKFKCNLNEYDQDCNNISLNLQNEINKCIIVPIVKLFGINVNNFNHELTYPNILNYGLDIQLQNNIPGYDYNVIDNQGYLTPYPLSEVLNSWNFANGLRDSKYNGDRCYTYFVMPLFDICEQILNYNFSVHNNLFNLNNPATKVNILGIFVDNTQRIPGGNNCNVFPGEFIIRAKFLKKPERYSIFFPRNDDCNVKSYTYEPNTQRTIFTGFKHIDRNHMDLTGGKYFTKKSKTLKASSKSSSKSKSLSRKASKSLTSFRKPSSKNNTISKHELWDFFAEDLNDEHKYIPTKKTLLILELLEKYKSNKNDHLQTVV